MSGGRWWNVFFGLTSIILAVLIGFTFAASSAQRIGAWITLAVIATAYLTIGRMALRTGRLAWVFALLLIAGSGTLVACSPNTAVVQAISFPLIWTVIESTRLAIVANFALAASVSLGFLLSLGFTADALLQTVVIEGISLVGSLALGMWITRIAELSRGRQRLLDELTATQEALAVANRDSGAVGERERLAREIHDTIAQSLTGVVMLSQRAQRELTAGDLGLLADQLVLLEESAREALVETRSLVAGSAAVGLGSGIQCALERLAARFTRETGTTVSVTTDISATLQRDSEVVLLRCVQEALANVRKHSGAGHVEVILSALGGSATLSVHDDGTGFDALRVETADSGFGLPGMRDRLALVDGALTVDSTSAGTTLTVALPIRVSA